MIDSNIFILIQIIRCAEKISARVCVTRKTHAVKLENVCACVRKFYMRCERVRKRKESERNNARVQDINRILLSGSGWIRIV